MLIISKAIAPWCKKHADGDHDDGGDGSYDYNAPAACTEPDGDADDGNNYDYASPAASMEGDDDDDDYDYAPAA